MSFLVGAISLLHYPGTPSYNHSMTNALSTAAENLWEGGVTNNIAPLTAPAIREALGIGSLGRRRPMPNLLRLGHSLLGVRSLRRRGHP